MSTARKKRLAFLIVALLAVFSGTVLLLCRMYKVMDPILLVGSIDLGVVLIVAGGAMGLLAPKIWKVRKKP